MPEFFQGFSSVFKLSSSWGLSLHNFGFDHWMFNIFGRKIHFPFPILKLFNFHWEPFDLFLNVRSGMRRYLWLMRMFSWLKQFVRLLMSFRIFLICYRLFCRWILRSSIVLDVFALVSQLLLSFFEFGLSVFEALFNLLDLIVIFKF